MLQCLANECGEVTQGDVGLGFRVGFGEEVENEPAAGGSLRIVVHCSEARGVAEAARVSARFSGLQDPCYVIEL